MTTPPLLPCERCGAPGTLRHFPGPVPVSGAWCDRCYRIVGLRTKVLRIGFPLLVVALFLINRACAR